MLNHPNFAPPALNISNQSTFRAPTSTLPARNRRKSAWARLALRLGLSRWVICPCHVHNRRGTREDFHVTERMRLRFEGTFTNLLNHRNFAPPPTNVTSSAFGVVQSVQAAENSGNRTGQLGLRFEF